MLGHGLGLIINPAAISRVLWPSPINCTTSRSRVLEASPGKFYRPLVGGKMPKQRPGMACKAMVMALQSSA